MSETTDQIPDHATRAIPTDARPRLTWQHVLTAYFIGSAVALAGSSIYGTMNERTRTVVIDANAECIALGRSAELSHLARDRADEHVNDILARSSALYGKILSGAPLEIDEARANWEASHMNYNGASSEAKRHRADMRAALNYCQPTGE